MTAGLALVAVQVGLAPHHLESGAAFRRLIENHAARAVEAAGDAEHRLLVFPEGIGYFLPLAMAPSAVLQKPTLAEAFAALAVRRPWSLVRGMFDAGGPRIRHGILHAVLPPADELMKSVFASIARRHEATVVAGSHLVAHPDGRITNTSYTFDPAGRLACATDKVNLVPTLEDSSPGGLGLTRGDPDGVPIHRAPWGRLATLICYDGFAQPHTRTERWAFVASRVDANGAQVLANPAANPWPWDGPWVFADPGEEILRREQWQTEGLPATLAKLQHARYGVTAHLCGQLLDQEFEGRSEVLARTGSEVEALARARGHQESDIACARVNLSSRAGRLAG